MTDLGVSEFWAIDAKAYLIPNLKLTSVFLPANILPSSLKTDQLLILQPEYFSNPSSLSIPATAPLSPSCLCCPRRTRQNTSRMFLAGLQAFPTLPAPAPPESPDVCEQGRYTPDMKRRTWQMGLFAPQLCLHPSCLQSFSFCHLTPHILHTLCPLGTA